MDHLAHDNDNLHVYMYSKFSQNGCAAVVKMQYKIITALILPY